MKIEKATKEELSIGFRDDYEELVDELFKLSINEGLRVSSDNMKACNIRSWLKAVSKKHNIGFATKKIGNVLLIKRIS